MSEDRRVKSLNRLFADFGLIPEGSKWAGQSQYQFKRGSDLRIPARKFVRGKSKPKITADLVREVTDMQALGTPEPVIKAHVLKNFDIQSAVGFEQGKVQPPAPGNRLFTIDSSAQYELGYQSHPHDRRWVVARWMTPDCTPEAWREKYKEALAFPKDGYFFILHPLGMGFVPMEDWTMKFVGRLKAQMSLNAMQHLSRIDAETEYDEREVDNNWKDYCKQTLVDHIPGVRGGSISVPATRFDAGV